MSRLFPDRLLLTLFPSEVRTARFGGGLKEKLVEEKRIPCDAAFGSEPWQGAVAALKSLDLSQPARVSVILSNHFVRYATVPWSNALGTAGEEDAYLRHHFVKIHGERAKAWVLRASAGAADAPRLASAIDAPLVEELKKVFPKGAKARLVSVQPQLMAAINRWRGAIPPAGAWLVLAESDRACVALHSGGGWRAVQSGKGEWLTLLERERHRVEGEIPNLVLIAGASAPSAQGAWQFRELNAT